jgi:hypothetical protein
MNFYKLAAGLSLALLLSSGFSGCGGSSSSSNNGGNEPDGFENETAKQVAKADGVIAKDEEITLRDKDGVQVAKITLVKDTELRDANGKNKCKCATVACNPCAVTVKRSCGSKAVDKAAKTTEVQAELDGAKLALLSASYTVKINRPIASGDEYTPAIDIEVKVPKCIHDKTTDTYFDYKKGKVLGIRVWIQTGSLATDGYWLKDGEGELGKEFTLAEIKSGKLKFKLNKPGVSITLIGIVKNPSATGATGTGGA